MKRRHKMQRGMVALAALFFFVLAVSYAECREVAAWVWEQEDGLCILPNGQQSAHRYEGAQAGHYPYDLGTPGSRTLPCRRSERSVPLALAFLISSFFSGRMLHDPVKGHFFACTQAYILSLARTLCELMILQKKDGKKRIQGLDRAPAGA